MRSRAFHTIAGIMLVVFSVLFSAQSQSVLTVSQYFSQVSKKFADIRDYQADIRITMEENELEWTGSLLFKKPDKLRIDYKEPAEQVLVFDGQKLIFYRPEYSTVFEQKIDRQDGGVESILPSDEALSLLKKNYSVAYLVGPNPVPLDEKSNEMVVKLKFRANSTAENFRELEIAFTPDGFYRRVKGITLNQTWTVDFTNVVINPGIPDPRFDYKYPANANVYPDFLYESNE